MFLVVIRYFDLKKNVFKRQNDHENDYPTLAKKSFVSIKLID